MKRVTTTFFDVQSLSDATECAETLTTMYHEEEKKKKRCKAHAHEDSYMTQIQIYIQTRRTCSSCTVHLPTSKAHGILVLAPVMQCLCISLVRRLQSTRWCFRVAMSSGVWLRGSEKRETDPIKKQEAKHSSRLVSS
jgi:hypothetical protein